MYKLDDICRKHRPLSRDTLVACETVLFDDKRAVIDAIVKENRGLCMTRELMGFCLDNIYEWSGLCMHAFGLAENKGTVSPRRILTAIKQIKSSSDVFTLASNIQYLLGFCNEIDEWACKLIEQLFTVDRRLACVTLYNSLCSTICFNHFNRADFINEICSDTVDDVGLRVLRVFFMTNDFVNPSFLTVKIDITRDSVANELLRIIRSFNLTSWEYFLFILNQYDVYSFKVKELIFDCCYKSLLNHGEIPLNDFLMLARDMDDIKGEELSRLALVLNNEEFN